MKTQDYLDFLEEQYYEQEAKFNRIDKRLDGLLAHWQMEFDELLRLKQKVEDGYEENKFGFTPDLKNS